MGTLFCLPQLPNSEDRMYVIEQSVGLVYNFNYLERYCVASICALDPGPANVRAALVGLGTLSTSLWPEASPSGQFPRPPPALWNTSSSSFYL